MLRRIRGGAWELEIQERHKSDTQALSYLHQASDFYSASETATSAARPLLLYYCFLNLAKVLLRVRAPGVSLRQARHGVSDYSGNSKVKRFTVTAQRVLIPTPKPGVVNIFSELATALKAQVPGGTRHRIVDLLAQCPAVHRSYIHASRYPQVLFAVPKAAFLHDAATKMGWATVTVRGLGALTAGKTQLERRMYFRSVFARIGASDSGYVFESKPTSYNGDPLEVLPSLSEQCQAAGMSSILTADGYRFYVASMSARARMHPLLASYLVTFYLGSVARYRPEDLDKILKGKWGWTFSEFLSTQGRQMVYLFANEVLGREVVKAWALGEDRFRL